MQINKESLRYFSLANVLFYISNWKRHCFSQNFESKYILSSFSFQCNIAHALEKTKYPDSDIYWKDFEEKYHFSCQFTADLIAMNHADFIITSTYQEIAGRFDVFLI